MQAQRRLGNVYLLLGGGQVLVRARLRFRVFIRKQEVGIASHLCCSCSVIQSCPTLCDPTDCSMPGFPVLHYLPEFAQIHVHWVNDTIRPCQSSVVPFSSCPQSFPAWGSFPVSWLFASGGQIIGASTSASVLSMSIQSWFPLGLTGLISLHFRGLYETYHSQMIKARVIPGCL